MGQGAHRMSARGLRDEIKATENQIRQQWHEKRQSSKNYLIDNISDEMAQYMKEKRLRKIVKGRCSHERKAYTEGC